MMESLPPSASFQDIQASVGIVFSAVTYLFDFSSNIATANEYHHMVEVRPSWIGILIGMLTVMAIAHITNAVIFKLELKKEDQPLKAAYFFPLMQLSRLVQVLWSTYSWKGIGNLNADEQNTLYNILSVSLETGPQLTLQFVVFILYYRKTSGKPPTTLTVSILASLLSGSVNGGFAALGVSCPKTRDTSRRVKVLSFITAGLFTTSALLLQCLTYTVLMLWGWNNGYPIAAYVTMELSFYFILFMILLRRRRPSAPNTFKAYCNGKRFLHCVALSYLSAKIGPLQPLTNDARVKGELGKAAYWYRLLLVSVAHLCLYGGVLLLCLVGPSNSRWSNLCPKHLSILPQDGVKGFPCGWYVPATLLGMVMYSLTIASHILMDNYVNKKKAENASVKVCPVMSINPFCNKEGQADLECTEAQIDDTNTSNHTEPQTKAHKGYADKEQGDEESEDSDVGKHHGEEIEIACEVATGETDSRRESQRSQGQVEQLSSIESKEESRHQTISPQVSCEEPVNQWGVIDTVGVESCEAIRESTSIPIENIGFQAKQEQHLGEEGMEVNDAGITPDESRRLEPARH